MREKEAEDLAQILAARYELPYVDLSRVIINNNAARLIPEETARKAKLIVYSVDMKNVSIAIQTPHIEGVNQVVTELTRQGYNPTILIASEYGIARAWEVYKEVSHAIASTAGVMSVSNETMQKYVSMIKTIADVKAVVDEAIGSGDVHSLSTVVEIILGGAVATSVSDVHIEPEK